MLRNNMFPTLAHTSPIESGQKKAPPLEFIIGRYVTNE